MLAPLLKDLSISFDQVEVFVNNPEYSLIQTQLAKWKETIETDGDSQRQLVVRTLRDWQNNPHLASIREPAELARLTQAQRAEFRKFWQDVADLLEKASSDNRTGGNLP